MSNKTIIAMGILGFLILCWFCISSHADVIQADLQSRASAKLTEAGISLKELRLDGRDAILTGDVSDEQIARQAEEIVSNVYGVRVVNNHLNIVPKTPDPPIAEETKPVVKEAVEKTQFELNTFLKGKHIEFETASAEISASSFHILNSVADILKKQPNVKIEIEGHTDNTGNAAFNQTLSQRRADAVRQYLIDKQISATRLESIGYGQSNPLHSNDTAEGRQLNRRVDFKAKEE